MADYRNLDVWQLSRTIVTTAYRFTELLPEAEKDGLSQQIKLAAIRVPSAIADGAGRDNAAQYAALAREALGALATLDTLVLLAADLEYVMESHTEDVEKRTRELAMKLRSVANNLDAESAPRRAPRFDRDAPREDDSEGPARRSYRRNSDEAPLEEMTTIDPDDPTETAMADSETEETDKVTTDQNAAVMTVAEKAAADTVAAVVEAAIAVAAEATVAVVAEAATEVAAVAVAIAAAVVVAVDTAVVVEEAEADPHADHATNF